MLLDAQAEVEIIPGMSHQFNPDKIENMLKTITGNSSIKE
jgi:hypothetical protein